MKREEIYITVKKYFEGKPVKKVSVFGSYATEKEGKESDLDILLELKKPVGLMELSRYKNDLQDKLGLNVDIGTEFKLAKREVVDDIKEELNFGV